MQQQQTRSTNKVVVFGIPRDTKVEVNGKSEKINAIDREGGIAEAAKAAKVVSNTRSVNC